MKKTKDTSLYDEKLQFEELGQIENVFQKAVKLSARAIPYALLTLVLITILEGYTGVLSNISGRTWQLDINRQPSNHRGQGQLSFSSLLAMIKTKAARGPLQQIIIGDSILVAGLMDFYHKQHDTNGNILGDALPNSVNLSQGAQEWGTSALMINRLSQETFIKKEKPTLIIDVNVKFFSYSESFSPVFPVEILLCSQTSSLSPQLEAVCNSLQSDWPKTLSDIGKLSPLFLRGLQGQFDFFMTFIQKSPIYDILGPRYGMLPLRSLTPGIVDAKRIIKAKKASGNLSDRPAFIADNSDANFAGNILKMYEMTGHKKHLWIDALANSVSQWPGKAIVLWVGFSPKVHALLNDENLNLLAKIRTDIMSKFVGSGKTDIKFVSIQDILPDPHYYVDMDHLIPEGHRRLGDSFRKF